MQLKKNQSQIVQKTNDISNLDINEGIYHTNKIENRGPNISNMHSNIFKGNTPINGDSVDINNQSYKFKNCFQQSSEISVLKSQENAFNSSVNSGHYFPNNSIGEKYIQLNGKTNPKSSTNLNSSSVKRTSFYANNRESLQTQENNGSYVKVSKKYVSKNHTNDSNMNLNNSIEKRKVLEHNNIVNQKEITGLYCNNGKYAVSSNINNNARMANCKTADGTKKRYYKKDKHLESEVSR